MSSCFDYGSCFMILIFSACYIVTMGSIQDKVRYHELISVHKTQTRIRRSLDRSTGVEKLAREFIFHTFNRTFNCFLTPRTDFFSRSFKLKVFGKDGIPKEHSFKKDQIYSGKCNGNQASEIRGVFIHGIFSGSLFYDGQLYGIENAKHHIPADRSMVGTHEERMIVYKTLDIRWDQGPQQHGHGPSFCGNNHSVEDRGIESGRTKAVLNSSSVPGRAGRYKRGGTPSWNTCQIITVADHKFYKHIGESDIYSTALYMAGVMDRVDDIYRKTEFNTGSHISGLGFEIAEMDIYVEPGPGFNRQDDTWDPLSLLQEFSHNLEYKDYCAAHLFTHQAFEGNVLGLAYIAPPREGGAGGICSPVARVEGVMSSLNTGWSSTQNQNHETVLMQQSDLVTAHELGHNWGAEHDTDSSDCTSQETIGHGKYLMYPYSVNGYDPNNYLFSPCSRDLISSVLALKGSSCLEPKSTDETQICGNGKLDPEEECDAGFMGRFMLNQCCDNLCRLRVNSSCSPVNHECCFECKVATAGIPCRSDNEIDCLKTAVCNGVSLGCPTPEFKNDGDPCLDEGTCQAGDCLPFCEAKGLIPCACEELDTSCLRCCRASEHAMCKPYDNKHKLPDGRPCVGGYCEGAVCKPSTASTIERLFDILEDLDVNNIVQFFRNNLVGCVIVFSLILWVPVCILISCKDRRIRKEVDKNENIEIRTFSLTSFE